MEYLLRHLGRNDFKIMTPDDPAQRGAQLSIVVFEDGQKVHKALQDADIICDWREPDCIRVAPAPFYNSFTDVYEFVQIFKQALQTCEDNRRGGGT